MIVNDGELLFLMIVDVFNKYLCSSVPQEPLWDSEVM